MKRYKEGFKARCIEAGTEITPGKEYTIIDVQGVNLVVLGDGDRNYCHPAVKFEVIEEFCPCCRQGVQDLAALQEAELFEMMQEFVQKVKDNEK